MCARQLALECAAAAPNQQALPGQAVHFASQKVLQACRAGWLTMARF